MIACTAPGHAFAISRRTCDNPATAHLPCERATNLPHAAFDMSELQISLLAIGFVLVLAVYGYNFYLERRFRRRSRAALQIPQPDVSSPQEAEDPLAVEEMLLSQTSEPVLLHGSADACDLLSDDTDYIAMLTLKTPLGAQVLAPIWQQRFDFGKNFHACGLSTASGMWERAAADSRGSYSEFRLALQLADRFGAASEMRLSDFRDMVRMLATRLQAELEIPDVAVAGVRAAVLDDFCAQVDQLTGLNIVPGGERGFSGAQIERVAAQYGMVFLSDGAFHLLDAQGHVVFSLCNFDNTPFQRHTLQTAWISGVTLLLDVPRVERPAQRFDEMAVLARQLAMDLHAAMVDDHQIALGETGIAQIRAQIADIEQRMLARDLVPGSAQARRLFS